MTSTGTILITGASAGIGRATARRFLKAGWHVGLFARNADGLAETAAGAETAHVLPGDVTSEHDTAAAVETLAKRTGRLDVLFNNAGMFTQQAPIDEIPVADWKRSIDVNLTGMFLTARAAFGQMRRQQPQGGRIINNGSISAHVPREGAVTYTAAKHGVTGLTRQISLDGRPYEIACGQLDIGNARTDIMDQVTRRAEAAGDPPPATIEVDHVVDAVWQMANLPLSANVQFMTLMATQMPFIGRG
jgi:NAD(P)-dependent dehydrogenase (short-subunit alcohol dehydrogenase family)